MESGRLRGGSWPVNVCSRNTLSSDDIADILTKVNGTKKSMKLFDGLQEEVSKIAKETTVSMLAIMRSGQSEEMGTLRRRKAELEEELMLTRDRLCITADDMVKLHHKMSLLQAENEFLREQLSKKKWSFSGKFSPKRVSAGNEGNKITATRKAGSKTACPDYKCFEGCCGPCAACVTDCCKMCGAGAKGLQSACSNCCGNCSKLCKNCFRCLAFLCQCKCCRAPEPKGLCQCTCR